MYNCIVLVCIAIEDLRFTVYQPLSLQGAGSLCIELGHVQGAAFVAGRRLSLQGAGSLSFAGSRSYDPSSGQTAGLDKISHGG